VVAEAANTSQINERKELSALKKNLHGQENSLRENAASIPHSLPIPANGLAFGHRPKA
jgi:hypothetical protein